MATLHINPVTRIEGHGKITVVLDDAGKVTDTRFAVHSFRGFERFLKGAPAERLPALTARVCGICYTAHHLASVRAIENAWGIDVSPATHKVRELMLLGQFLESHVLSLVVLSLPDLLNAEAQPERRNVAQLLKDHKAVAERALGLRMAGSRFAAIAGRRAVHPVAAVIGGMAAPITIDERDLLIKGLEENRAALDDLAALFMDFAENADPDILALGNIFSNYLALSDEGRLAFYRGRLHLRDAEGKDVLDFDPTAYFDHVVEDETEFSYMKFPRTKEGATFRVGPLARVNFNAVPTEFAASLLTRIEGCLPRPWHKSMAYHLARLIETAYAWERARELLADAEITSTDVKPERPVKMRDGVGVGVLEAPRGVLVHRYELSADGFCRDVDLVVATQHNNAAINESLHETAVRLISGPAPGEAVLNRLEMIVRAYDPCLSCATHHLSSRAFAVEVVDVAGCVLGRYS